MKKIVFDTGPIISLAINNLLWILEPLRKQMKGEFYITPLVKYELVDKPLETKKFKFEALQVLQIIRSGILKVVHNNEIQMETAALINTTNKCFKAHGSWITIMHTGEIECVAAVRSLTADALVADERTVRLLIENPIKLRKRLQSKLHTNVQTNTKNLEEIKKSVKGIRLIRSVELVTIAYKLGILDKFLTEKKNSKHTLLEGLLWGMKLNGCAVSEQEVEEILRTEL